MASVGGFAGAVNPKPIAEGLSGAIGAALDEVNNQLYFVDYNTGELNRLGLTPTCLDLDTVTKCTIHSVASGFSHPENVVLDVGAGIAYVTTRDPPGSGGLYRVDLGTGSKTLVTFNLGDRNFIFRSIERTTHTEPESSTRFAV